MLPEQRDDTRLVKRWTGLVYNINIVTFCKFPLQGPRKHGSGCVQYEMINFTEKGKRKEGNGGNSC
jgi:hypothetical protein